MSESVRSYVCVKERKVLFGLNVEKTTNNIKNLTKYLKGLRKFKHYESRKKKKKRLTLGKV